METMKKRKWGMIVAICLICSLCCACGQKYTCSRCGKSVSEAYYDPFDTDSYFCKDCAKEYFAPFPYTSYRVN